MNEALNVAGWEIVEPIGGDASTRRYTRVARRGVTAILMDCSAEQTRGHALSDFVRIASWLNEIGLNAPDIYELDEKSGYAVIEDFGDITLSKALEIGERPETLYGCAAEVLNYLVEQDCPLELPDYYDSHVYDGRRFLIEYFRPLMAKEPPHFELVKGYFSVWEQIEASLPACSKGFMHVDYHAQNLMWIPGHQGMKRIGILDFQGAMFGPKPYDLANLLEDPRQDIDSDLRSYILSHYHGSYKQWYRILGTQFHCRVLGQFVKLAMAGKSGYLDFIPRTYGYMREALRDPVLAPLKAWLLDHHMDFEKPCPKIDTHSIRLYISE